MAGGSAPCEHRRRRLLGLGHVRLVERVDAEHRAAHGGGQLPEQHLAAEVERAAVAELDHRVAGVGQRREAVVLADADEEPVVAVDLGRAEPLAGDGDHPGALLAGGLGEELLEPEPERLDVLVDDERDLVPAGLHRRAEDRRRAGAPAFVRGSAGRAEALGHGDRPCRGCPASRRRPAPPGTIPKYDSAE